MYFSVRFRRASLLRGYQIHDGHRNGLVLALVLGLHYARPDGRRPALYVAQHGGIDIQRRAISTYSKR